MPTERILIEVLTTANLSGLKEATAGIMGFTPQILLAGAALAGIVFVGKSALENYEAQEKATKDLEQAYRTQNDTLAAHKKEIEAWLESNKQYIENQYDVQAALAAVVRAGHNETDAMRMLNDALDLSVAKHSSVSEAAEMLIKVEAGAPKVLKFLGITTAEYNAIMKSKLSLEEKDAALLALVEPKVKGLRNTTTELSQSQNALNKDWQDFSKTIGPSVVKGLDLMTKGADILLGQLKDDIAFIVGIPHALGDVFKAISGPSGPAGQITNRAGPHGGAIHGASGFEGTVSGPTYFLAGEGGASEDVSIRPRGAGSGGAPVVNVDLRGAFLPDGPSIDRLANLIASRLSYATGR